MTTKRFQLDLSEVEHDEMERLMATAGIKTKREFVSNALTLFRWAVAEVEANRRVGSFTPAGDQLKQMEMPALAAIASARARLDERTANRPATPAATDTRPMSEVLAELRKKLAEIEHEEGRTERPGPGRVA